MTRRFTGGHMLALMIAFFGVVIAVNVTMATLATRTFGGTVVDNSYVATQRFNGWLREAREQAALGWTVEVTLDGERRIDLALGDRGAPLDGAAVEAIAAHPLGRAADLPLRFEPLGNGRYRALTPLPEGRWNAQLTVARGDERLRLIEPVR